MKTAAIILTVLCLFSFGFASIASAAGESEFIVEKKVALIAVAVVSPEGADNGFSTALPIQAFLHLLN